MKHENEMAIGDLSSIHDNGHEDLMYNTNGVQQLIMLGEGGNEKGKQQKLKYLKFLQEKNKVMCDEIKSLGKQLDSQIQKIKKKGFFDVNKLTHKKRNPRVKFSRSSEVEEKYEEMNRLKKQIQTKMVKKQALSLLQNRYRNLRAEFKIKYTELQMKERTYNELLKLEKEGHKMKDSSHETEPSSNFLNNSSKNKSVNYLKEQKEQKEKRLLELQLQNYQNEAKSLKNKIKQESVRVYKEKDLFIKNNKANKNNKHYKNNSLSNIKTKEQEDEEHLSAKALEYKKEYEIVGKRIQLLRIQKLALTSSTQDNEDKKKYLHHLKVKLTQIKKLLK